MNNKKTALHQIQLMKQQISNMNMYENGLESEAVSILSENITELEKLLENEQD